jgi:hypothetical protein
MNLDDPTLLSAYLDDELDPAARARFEAELESDPRLARRLREAARLRDALAALPRLAAPAGFAVRVLSRIEQAEAHRSRRARERRARLRRLLVLTPVTAAAAALLVIWSLEGLGPHVPTGPGPAPGPAVPSPRVARLDPGPAAPGDGAPAAEVGPPALAGAHDPSPAPDALPDAALARLDRDRLDAQAQLRELLARPDAARVVLRLDRLDGPAVARVEQAVSDLVRSVPRHARLDLPGGLALDPTLPGPAVVFAVPLEENEPERLLAHLAARVPDATPEVRPVPPAVLAQLGETVGVAFGEDAEPAAPLLETGAPSLHAAKSDTLDTPDRVQVVGPPIVPGLPVVVPDRPRAHAAHEADPDAERPEVGPVAPPSPRPRGPFVYLVWVVAR